MITWVWKWVPKTIDIAGFFPCSIGMERPYSSVDEEHIGILGFTVGIHIFLVVFFCVPSMKFIGSPEMEKIVTLVIISGTR